jgi:hypothetical protein
MPPALSAGAGGEAARQAYLDNGKVLNITITRNGNEIEVEIPWQQFFR